MNLKLQTYYNVYFTSKLCIKKVKLFIIKFNLVIVF